MKEDNYQPISEVTRSILTTEEAAFYLNRKPQTLRIWAMKKSKAPIKPVNIFGRLGWKTDEVRSLI